MADQPDNAAKPDKPANRELVSAALRMLARRDMSRSEFITKLTKISSPRNKAQSPKSSSGWRSKGQNRGAIDSRRESLDAAADAVFNTDNKAGAIEFTTEEIEAVTAWCAAEGFLNEARFAEGKARSLGARYGAKRVGATLKQKGVAEDVIAETISVLKETDLARARAMWLRKFSEPATNSNDRNKQIRYLQSRGFGFDVIKRVINGAIDED